MVIAWDSVSHLTVLQLDNKLPLRKPAHTHTHTHTHTNVKKNASDLRNAS